MHLMSRGNNVKRCDTSCKSAIKMPSLLSTMPSAENKRTIVLAGGPFLLLHCVAFSRVTA